MVSTTPIWPVPPPGKQGWPWYESAGFRPQADAGWPKISIVTPSYNQGRYVEEAIRSVLLQNYPNLEYIIIEDGSNDNSPEVIGKYRHLLAGYVTGPNRGNGEAVNAGQQLSTGQIMACLDADNYYLPDALMTVAQVFKDCPEVEWIAGAGLLCDQSGRSFAINSCPGYSKRLFFSGRYLGGHPAWNGKCIPHESVFYRRSLWQRAGGYFKRDRAQYTDFELWSRFFHHADLHVLPVPLAAYRCHPASYTATKGGNSLGLCTEILASSRSCKYRPLQIRLRDLACRLSSRVARCLGEPAKGLEFDTQTNRWHVVTRYVM